MIYPCCVPEATNGKANASSTEREPAGNQNGTEGAPRDSPTNGAADDVGWATGTEPLGGGDDVESKAKREPPQKSEEENAAGDDEEVSRKKLKGSHEGGENSKDERRENSKDERRETKSDGESDEKKDDDGHAANGNSGMKRASLTNMGNRT